LNCLTQEVVKDIQDPAKMQKELPAEVLESAASFTAITVPQGFALLIRRWGEQLTTPQSDIM